MTKRNMLILGLVIPIAAVVALLGVALARSGGNPGGLLVNTASGEVFTREGQAQDFTFQTLNGESVTLSDMRGNVVMVDFWSSWCAPCRAEAPDLVETYDRYRDRGVEFIGLAIWDDRGQVEGFVSRYGVTYLNGLDETGRIAIDYGVRGIPEKYFIDRDGNVVKKFVGLISAEKLGATLDELLLHPG